MNKKLILFLFFLVIFSSFLITKKVLASSSCTPTRDKCYMAYQLNQNGSVATTCLCYDGLVPCGKEVDKREYTHNTCNVSNNCISTTTVNCQLCHFFIMLNEIIKFVVNNLVPPIAILLIVYAGILIYFGGESPKMLSSGKNIIKYVAIGLFLIYGSFMLVGELLAILGATEKNPVSEFWDKGNLTITINCTPTYY
jgi:hypothetical protein